MKFKILLVFITLIFGPKYSFGEAIYLDFHANIGDSGLKNGKNIYKEIKSASSVVTYTAFFDFDKNLDCVLKNDCYLYLGQVSDSYAIEINGKQFFGKSDNLAKDYTSFESTNFFLPLDVFKLGGKNQIKIIVADLNKSIFGLLEDKIFISAKKEVYFRVFKDFFLRTGSSLISTYNLAVLCFLLIIIYFFSMDGRIFYVLLYGLVAQVYLFSFSEIPRLFFNPEFMSGVVHFPLRLSQDFMLFICFSKILPNLQKKHVKTIFALYVTIICAHLLTYFLFGINFILQEMIITAAAPLVALPAGYLLYNSIRNINLKLYRKIFLFTTMFFVCQLNDLLNFWKIISTFYTVKIYIPFIILLIMYIIIDDFYEKIILEKSYASTAKLTTRIAHDIRSPLTALSIVKNSLDKGTENYLIIDATISRIQGIANEVLNIKKQTVKKAAPESFTSSLDLVIGDILQEKRMLYPDLIFKKINNKSAEDSFFSQTKTISKPDEVGRIFSNILDNSAQALTNSLNLEKEIFYEMLCDDKYFAIRVKDNGPGIEPSILKQLGSKELTTKPDGNGIALAYAKKLLRSWNGDLTIESEKDKFTTVTISLARTV